MNRYLPRTLFTALLLATLVALGNWLANPYLLFNGPVIDGVNRYVTENFYQQLLFKPYQLRHASQRSVILGASQAGVAFNPALLPQPAYNLAVGGSTAYLQYRLLQEAIHSSNTLDTVVFETPFFAFNSSDPNNEPGRDPAFEQRLSLRADGSRNLQQPFSALEETLSGLIGWDSTRASLRMMAKQTEVATLQRGSFIQWRNGQWQQQPPPGTSTRLLMENSWKKTIYNDWLPAPRREYTLPDRHSSTLANFRDSLRLLQQHRIRTRIVIAPLHASLFIALQETGLWPTFQQWKRELVAINDAVARETGQPPFPLYDYATVNALTAEPLPTDNTTARLQWFNDSMHPSPAFGDLVLQEIISGTLTYGRLLDGSTIDTVLAGDEEALARYTALHPQQQAALRTLLANDPRTNPRLSR